MGSGDLGGVTSRWHLQFNIAKGMLKDMKINKNSNKI